VAGRGGTVDLGTKVTTTDTLDRVAMNITGLPKYETITSALDGQTFRGRDITLTAAQVNSGLTLTSYYRGGGLPVATLSLTATATDRTTGDVATTSPQAINVTDPRPARVTTTTSPHTTTTVTDRSLAPATSITATDHPVASTASAGFLASRGFAQLQQHMESTTNTLATTRPQAIVTDPQLATGATTSALASQSFALLNQYLAGNSGRVDPGQIVATLPQATGWGQGGILARPQH
jgi:hypothetical protein